MVIGVEARASATALGAWIDSEYKFSILVTNIYSESEFH